MEPSVKDKHIIWGFVGFAILLISSIATLIVAEKFNQDNFVRLIVFVCSNLLGWLLYFSLQTVIFDTYEIYRIKFGKKKTPSEITEVQEDQLQDAHKPVTPASMPTGGEVPPDIRPTEIAISPELHEKNRADYEDREQRENEERISMVMEYIHFIMPRIADKETVNHICGEVNNWMRLHSYKPKPIEGRLTKDISNIPLRHFVWNISERFMYKKYYTGDNRARFISTLFPHEFADTDIATIKNFKVEPLKTLIPIDEPENGRLDFHYPADHVREEYNQPFHNQ
jgi:tnpC